jgi:hypothetical protein
MAAFYPESKEKLKCPAEENANCERSPLTNAKKSCGKTDIRTNKPVLQPVRYAEPFLSGKDPVAGRYVENGFFFIILPPAG